MTYRPKRTRHFSITQRIADDRRGGGTRAERELERILNEVNGGVLRGRFQREWACGKQWIVDFFFPEIRLGIEVDGGYHRSLRQQFADVERELAVEKFGITVVRVTNEEVFGDREALLVKLRKGWRLAQVTLRKSTQLAARKRKPQNVGASQAQARRSRKSTGYSGGWTSIRQGVSRVGDSFERLFVNEGIGESRDAHRAMKKSEFAEMRKRSRGG